MKKRGIRVVLVALAVAALAACGSSGSTSKNTSSTKPSTTSAPTTSGATTTTTASTATVKLESNARFGTILVDADGKTLYTLTKDGAPVACTGQCLVAWPPLLLVAGTTTPSGDGVSDLGTLAADGGTQVTIKGAPLYRFSADTAAGAANGDGISSFGGVWHVVKGADIARAGSTDDTTATTEDDTSTTADPYGY